MTYVALVVMIVACQADKPYHPLQYDNQEIDIFADVTEQDLIDLAGD